MKNKQNSQTVENIFSFRFFSFMRAAYGVEVEPAKKERVFCSRQTHGQNSNKKELVTIMKLASFK